MPRRAGKVNRRAGFETAPEKTGPPQPERCLCCIDRTFPFALREPVVLAPVRLVGDDDDVRAVRQLRMSCPLLGVELLDQREDVAMILGQQLPEVLAARRLGLLLGDGAAGHELLVDLIVQLVAVGDDDEGPVARQRAQDLLREERSSRGSCRCPACARTRRAARARARLSFNWRTASIARLTPRYWWFLATILARSPFSSSKAVKFSTRSSRRGGSQVPRLWPQMLAMAVIGATVLSVSVFRFRKSLD